MEQTELEKHEAEDLLKKHWKNGSARKDNYFDMSVKAIQEAYSLNRSVPKELNYEKLAEEINLIWSHACRGFHTLPNNLERRKEATDMIIDIIKDKLPITLLLPVIKSETTERVYSKSEMHKCFQAGRNYQIGEYSEYHGGEEHDYPDADKFINSLNKK